MSAKRQALRFVFETIVGNVLSKVGEHLGEVVGVKLARKIDPEYMPPEPKDPEPEP